VDEMGHVWISVKVNFKVCFQGKWSHRIAGKIEFPNVLELNGAKSRFQNKEFTHLMGWKCGMSGYQKNELPNLLELKLGTPD